MAKNVKKTPTFGVLDNLSEPQNNDTHNHTHTHKNVIKERKTKRIQILTYDSLIDRVDAYCKTNDVSRAEFFEAAVNEYLSNKGL